MPLTQDQVSQILIQARSFYKGGLKSSNKMYSTDEGDKRRLRNEKVRGYNGGINGFLLDDLRYGTHSMSDYELGRWLMQTDSTVGNCVEMCAVVAHLAKNICGREAFIQMAELIDHKFVLLSPKKSKVPASLPSIGALAHYESSWVIDCWANIACPANQYPASLSSKLSQWSMQGKQIYDLSNHDYVDPLSASMTESFFNSGVHCVKAS